MRGATLVLVAISTVAHASPAAEKLFEDGRKLFGEGKLDEACDSFRRSQELEARVGTLLNLGNCEEKRGKTATAWAAFVDARELARRTSDKRFKEAEKRAAALAPVLPYLTVKVDTSATPGIAIQRNGTTIAVAELGVEAPIDPGSYTIQASASGFASWSKTIELAAGAHEVVEVPALEALPEPTKPAVTTAVEPKPAAPAPHVDAPAAPLAHADITRHLGVGLVGGFAQGARAGLRITGELYRLKEGALRVIATGTYGQPDDPGTTPLRSVRLVEVSGAFEYVAMLAPHFVFAGGVAMGTAYAADQMMDPFGDYVYGSLGRRDTWWSLRGAPTLRLGRLDIAAIIQLYGKPQAYATSATSFDVSIDYFFW